MISKLKDNIGIIVLAVLGFVAFLFGKREGEEKAGRELRELKMKGKMDAIEKARKKVASAESRARDAREEFRTWEHRNRERAKALQESSSGDGEGKSE